jgi:uncharacterized protein YwqG
MKNKQTFINDIEKYAVEPYKQRLFAEIQPSIRLKTTGVLCPEIGTTKLGGCPDFSKNINWPRSNFDNRHLTFLGQIKLREVKVFDELDLLPKSGLLYFFFNLDSGDDGKVIYSNEENALERANPPEEFKVQKKSFWQRLVTGKSKKRILKESQVLIYKEYDMPSWDSLKLERIQKETKTNIKPSDSFIQDNSKHIDEEEESETTSCHRLTGNYKGIQNEMYELDFLETPTSNIDNITLDEINAALRWKLLFQFDSDDNLDHSFCDWGRIYFFIHEDDLKNQNFDNVKISADCY